MASHAPGAPAIPAPEGRTLEDFKRQMEDMWDVQRNKNKAKQEKKKLERIGKQIIMADQFKRAQRYLGLRPTAKRGTLFFTQCLRRSSGVSIDPSS
jgi:hypothetical protein